MSEVPWFDGKHINEIIFGKVYLEKHPLKCVNGTFFGKEGMTTDAEIEKKVYEVAKPYLNRTISKKVKQLVDALKLEAHVAEIPIQIGKIHVQNGTYCLDAGFQEEKQFCLNRLQVSYKPDAENQPPG